MFSALEPTSHLHTAPIYVSLKNRPGINKQGARDGHRQELFFASGRSRKLLSDENAEFLASGLENPNFDAVPKETFLNNRPDLLEEIRVAKEFFKSFSEQE